MPYGLRDSAMAESPDGRGVLLFGGTWKVDQQDQQEEKRIFELRAGADTWKILNVTLESTRREHVVIPLPLT